MTRVFMLRCTGRTCLKGYAHPGTETPDPFENTAILALVRNAFIWLSEYSVLMISHSPNLTRVADEMNSTLSMFDTVSIDNAQIRAPSRWDG
jgi:hypothetical protein